METAVNTYIKHPMETGQIPPKIRGACRHLLGQYDPELHAIVNGIIFITMNENLYPKV